MILIAVLNGTARDLGYKKYLGELLARQLSTIVLIIVFGIYIGLVLQKYPPANLGQSVKIGILWLVLTLLFEFGLGVAGGKSWAELFSDYNILQGQLWGLVPLWVAVAPYLFYIWNNK
jgi:hypothetical protein